MRRRVPRRREAGDVHPELRAREHAERHDVPHGLLQAAAGGAGELEGCRRREDRGADSLQLEDTPAPRRVRHPVLRCLDQGRHPRGGPRDRGRVLAGQDGRRAHPPEALGGREAPGRPVPAAREVRQGGLRQGLRRADAHSPGGHRRGHAFGGRRRDRGVQHRRPVEGDLRLPRPPAELLHARKLHPGHAHRAGDGAGVRSSRDRDRRRRQPSGLLGVPGALVRAPGQPDRRLHGQRDVRFHGQPDEPVVPRRGHGRRRFGVRTRGRPLRGHAGGDTRGDGGTCGNEVRAGPDPSRQLRVAEHRYDGGGDQGQVHGSPAWPRRSAS